MPLYILKHEKLFSLGTGTCVNKIVGAKIRRIPDGQPVSHDLRTLHTEIPLKSRDIPVFAVEVHYVVIQMKYPEFHILTPFDPREDLVLVGEAGHRIQPAVS